MEKLFPSHSSPISTDVSAHLINMNQSSCSIFIIMGIAFERTCRQILWYHWRCRTSITGEGGRGVGRN